jgi:hypothetical protein
MGSFPNGFSYLTFFRRGKMKRIMILTLSLALVGSALAAPPQSTPTKKKPVAKKADDVAAQLNDMKQSIEAQQQQIRQLSQQVQSRDQRIQQLEQRLDQSQAATTQAQAQADSAASQAANQAQTVTALKSDVTDLKANAINAALSLQETQKNIKDQLESPMAIHYKGVTLTPVGFVAAETVYRTHALASDVNTPFNSIPYNGATTSNLSEFFGSGRQSRIGLLAEGKLSSATIGGYYEADFLSSAITSNNNQSNSYSLRQRQLFAQAALNSGWKFTGGQMWSLVTETKKGEDNRTEALPMTIDAAYTVGFSWARQYGFRVAKDFGDKMWLGFSVEDSQATLGGHGASNNFVLGEQGTSGGVYNPTTNYSFNAMPDFVAKAAFEPGIGHYEVFGIVSDFRDRIFPNATAVTPSATGAYNNSSIGGGVGANARVSFLDKHVDAGVHFLGGKGIGRYGSAGLPDLVARPSGVLDPLKEYQGLGTLEFHAKKLDVYFNYGGEYAARTSYNSGTTGIGYGSDLFVDSGCDTETLPTATSVTVVTPTGTTTVPTLGSTGTPLTGGYNPGGLGKCSGDTKSIFEASTGFWYRFYKGPKGTLQFGPQYSYVIRNAWSDKNGLNPQATENMFFTSFRFYLP